MLAFCSASALMAQAPGGPKGFAGNDRIDSMRTEFITRQLGLTEAEAKSFWPVFGKFEEEKRALRKPGQHKSLDIMSDAEVGTFIKDYLDTRQKEADLYKKYVPEFRKILPERKVAKLLTLEGEFKKMLLQKAGPGPGPKGKGWKGGPMRPDSPN